MSGAHERDTSRARKARGAFFTPEPVAEHLTCWAIRDRTDVVVEPSCGEAAFLLPAARRLAALGTDLRRPGADQLRGYELHPASAEAARALLREEGLAAEIQTGDFFDVTPEGSASAVVGNPPFVRFHGWAGAARDRAQEAARRAGVRLTSLASSWAAFTVHAAQFLRPDGRLALVLPAELLTVNYAADVRDFLLRRFARIRIVTFSKRVFPDIQEEVVLLLAEGSGPADRLEIRQLASARDLDDVDSGITTTWRPENSRDRWSPALVAPAARDLYEALTRPGDGFAPLLTWGETTLGMVTGANGFFALSPREAQAHGLDDEDTLPVCPPGSRHLRGLSYTAGMARRLGTEGSATVLFRPREEPSHAARVLIARGESEGVHHAYKCRVRRPWWRVPLVPPADLLLTCMNADSPRLTTNSAGAHHLNSVHGVYLAPDHREIGRRLLPLASLTSVTLLGAEIVGRAYGGGMLKIEPGEADRWPVPSPELVDKAHDDLVGARRRVRDLLARGHLTAASAVVDRILLVDVLGLDPRDVAEFVSARGALVERRRARARSGTAR
ncbi:MAG: N-6 DNA methylase [Kineosporiaceae bacterium]